MKTGLYLLFLCLVSCLTIACENSTEVEETKPIVNEKDYKKEFTKYGISDSSIVDLKAFEVGEKAPDFSGFDQNGNLISLSELNQEGDVVLIFYRGYWCPHCSKSLSKIADVAQDIKTKGASIIAIAPEGEGGMKAAENDLGSEIILIRDADQSIMKKYNVAFKVNERYNKKFSSWKGVSLAEINEQDEAVLPIPATYIIGDNGKIKYAFFSPNYTDRASVREILAHL